MGKLQQFDITFANNKVVYSPGESVSGTVKIRTGHPLHYKGKLTFSSVFNRGGVERGGARRQRVSARSGGARAAGSM